MPGERDFSPGLRAKPDSLAKVIDSAAGFGRFLPQMALNFPCLPPNPLRPRAFGGKGADGMKKEISSKDTPLCNVWLTMLHGIGIDLKQLERHGDSTGVMKELNG